MCYTQKLLWLSLYGCYFLIYVIILPCSLQKSLTRNQTLFNVWLHVRAHHSRNLTKVSYLDPFAYNTYQDIQAEHQYHHLQSSGWTAHQSVTGHISTIVCCRCIAVQHLINKVHTGLKQWIWEDPIGTMMSVGRFCWNNGVSGTIVLIVRDKILW